RNLVFQCGDNFAVLYPQVGHCLFESGDGVLRRLQLRNLLFQSGDGLVVLRPQLGVGFLGFIALRLQLGDLLLQSGGGGIVRLLKLGHRLLEGSDRLAVRHLYRTALLFLRAE
ncbi:unnamed protein product, partial [Ectocarpus sp. 12 AP-2014]